MSDAQREGSVPIAGTVLRWDAADRVGALSLASGEVVRFGGSACHDVSPVVGMRVFVSALGPHPLGGRRALSVRARPLTEAEARAYEQARRDAELRSVLRPLAQAESRLPPMPLPPGFVPSLRLIAPALPRGVAALLPIFRDEIDALSAAGLDIITDGSRLPTPFYDPSLWPFAIDAKGSLFALHVYPPRLARSVVPVVLWDPEERIHFVQAEGLRSFLGEWLARASALPRRERARILERWALRPGTPGRSVQDWPLPSVGEASVPLGEREREERAHVRALIEASPHVENAITPLAVLDILYHSLGWAHHQHVLRHQRARFFEVQRRRLAARLRPGSRESE